MMFFQGFLILLAIVAIAGAPCLAVIAWSENKGYKWTATIVTVVVWSLFLGAVSSYEQENPCIESKTIMQYNPATKTMLPTTVCTKRQSDLGEIDA